MNPSEPSIYPRALRDVVGEYLGADPYRALRLLEELPEAFTARQYVEAGLKTGAGQEEALAWLGALMLTGAVEHQGVLLTKGLAG